MMNNSKVEINVDISFINKCLVIFKMDQVQSLDEIVELDKSLFDVNNEKLKLVVNEYVDILKTKYGANKVGYYSRNTIKDYPRVLFFDVLKLNNIKLKGSFKTVRQDKDTFKRIYCYRKTKI
jgi:hypothetical protein